MSFCPAAQAKSQGMFELTKLSDFSLQQYARATRGGSEEGTVTILATQFDISRSEAVKKKAFEEGLHQPKRPAPPATKTSKAARQVAVKRDVEARSANEERHNAVENLIPVLKTRHPTYTDQQLAALAAQTVAGLTSTARPPSKSGGGVHVGMYKHIGSPSESAPAPEVTGNPSPAAFAFAPQSMICFAMVENGPTCAVSVSVHDLVSSAIQTCVDASGQYFEGGAALFYMGKKINPATQISLLTTVWRASESHALRLSQDAVKVTVEKNPNDSTVMFTATVLWDQATDRLSWESCDINQLRKAMRMPEQMSLYGALDSTPKALRMLSETVQCGSLHTDCGSCALYTAL